LLSYRAPPELHEPDSFTTFVSSPLEAFNVPGSVRVRVELASDQADNVRPRSDALPPVQTLEDVRKSGKVSDEEYWGILCSKKVNR
jgi:hypothetical protein